MEDILASIKRIIADDNPLPRRHSSSSAEPRPFERAPAPPPQFPRTSFGSAVAPDVQPDDDSILELTTPAPALPPLQPPPLRAHLHDQQKPWPPEEVPAVSRVVDRLRQSEAASAQARAASIAAAPEPEPPVPAPEPHSPAPISHAPPLSSAVAGGMTLEALVRDMLRPMLSEWIDTHMPAIVERLVKQEIEGLPDEQG
jgi:cell pole-organizing protein PopZ